MVDYFIYAKDFSASTKGVVLYHTYGLKSLKEFKENVEKIKGELLATGEPQRPSKILYLHWGHECFEVDESETTAAYLARRCGNMGTDPSCIINCLKQDHIKEGDKIKLLYIITDGCIAEGSADKCFELNKDLYYENVIFHAFSMDPQYIDLSVAASFFKSHTEVYCNNDRYASTDISKEFDYDKINCENFLTEKDNLMSYIQLKFINKFLQNDSALQEIDKLKKLRDRLFKELSSKPTCEIKKPNLETKDKKVFLSEFVKTGWYRSLTGTDYSDKVLIEKCISTAINFIVSDVKSYSFDAMKFVTKFNQSVKVEDIVDVNFTPEQEIEFPDIILDDDKGIPVIILTKFNLMDKIVFHRTQPNEKATSASFSKFRSTMECPLFLVTDPNISESIGYFYTLNVYKQFLANNTKTEPRTRRPFHGGLVLTDTSQFDKYNDYILSATYFDGKKLNYNVGLFYFVLWKNCENKEWMDKNVVEQFKKYAMRRISETVCKIGLSSLPLDPQENTSLLTALWYCVELSSYIFKKDPTFFSQERIRQFHRVTPYMIEILKFFNYDLDMDSIEKRRDLFSHVMTLKKINRYIDKVYYLLKGIFKTVNGFLVSEIENPSNLSKLNYLNLNHKVMLWDELIENKVHLNDYVHMLYFEGDLDTSKAGASTFDICEKTFRPYFVIDQNKSFYTGLFNNSKKVVINNDDDKDRIEVAYEAVDSLEFDKVLPLYKLFTDCVRESKKYPTLSEYVEHVLKRKKFNKELVTVFPPNVYFDVKLAYERYQKIVNKVEVAEFVTVYRSNFMRIKRIKAEERVKFSSDKEIDEFISSEESKVKLIKKTQLTSQ